MTFVRAIGLALAAVVAAEIVSASPSAHPQSGDTARATGRVVTTDTADPVRGAVVTLRPVSGTASSSATTDQNGRFDMRDVPSGTFQFSVRKSGFIMWPPLMAEFRVQVKPGETRNLGEIRLMRAGVIAGVVYDRFGEPVGEAALMVDRVTYATPGSPTTGMQRFTTADDLGRFRLYGLAPGTYVLKAGLANPTGRLESPDLTAQSLRVSEGRAIAMVARFSS